ncbi:NAD-dependent epimerase/dehydratase family protein [Natranaeroarchaeum aerophilus]|uniref:NAD(P)-dependent oxidoreductase n=1 Tax=Natranaeroarchaeum aerophilus TaxID=2917711 RepID=A0AAE3FT88_9EURY|nr:NAD(P)-dependent oxidoreductase [Natranaeroarchaeum aerophilus]MCL9814189.1 NAD(P)-dependent oxidoreductase [Natranaeroarchaeum aerophilus]
MMETIVVTGALGGAGKWIVDRLRADYEVVALDQRLPATTGIEGVSFQKVDLTQQGPVWETIVDADPSTVVHFGNIPHEENHAGGDVYENNAVSTFHVLEAAGRAGADVVWASSETVYGTHWPEPKLPEYLPVDEEHPVAPWNGYETSKLAGEAAAERVANAFDVAVTTMRPTWIQYPGRYQITSIREAFDFESAGRFGNFWSYVDVRDVVSFVEAAIDEAPEGHEVYNVFGPDNFLGVDTADAIEAGYGSLPEECRLEGDESAYTNAKATATLGWEPEQSWKTAEDENISAPSFDV